LFLLGDLRLLAGSVDKLPAVWRALSSSRVQRAGTEMVKSTAGIFGRVSIWRVT
jgi:hypothetical protein